MSNMLSIAMKEFKSFTKNPTFYIMMTFVTLILSALFTMQLQRFFQMGAMSMMQPGAAGQANIHYTVFLNHLQILNLILIFIVPAITMRLFSEEKKLRTFDLLLTCPLKSFEIVVGKYLGALMALFVIFFIAFLYPLGTVLFAKLNWAPLLIAFFGIYLISAVYAAMNLFCSSLSESILISYVTSALLNIAVWFISQAVEFADTQWVRDILEHISLSFHISGLIEGTIRTNSLIYFFSTIGLFLFLNERVVESHRWR